MSSDVYMTRPDGDLDFRDVLRDANKTPKLVAQQAHTVTQIGAGEWALNTNDGIDWLKYLTDRRPDLGRLEEELRVALLLIPQITLVTRITLAKSARTVTGTIEAYMGSLRLNGQLILQETVEDQIGDNAIFSVFFPALG